MLIKIKILLPWQSGNCSEPQFGGASEDFFIATVLVKLFTIPSFSTSSDFEWCRRFCLKKIGVIMIIRTCCWKKPYIYILFRLIVFFFNIYAYPFYLL